ncbi:hypothetical protein LPJ59_006208, partial [Coemansia sp. RSA 2399]
PLEAPAADEKSEADAVVAVVDLQPPVDAETAADESSEPAAPDSVSDLAQVVGQPSEQPPVEDASESEEHNVDPRSVDEVAAPDATSVSVPTDSVPSVADEPAAPVIVEDNVDAPVAPSDEPVVPAAVDISADKGFQGDTAEPALDASEPSADAQPSEEPATEEIAVEEKADAPSAVDEKLDADVGEVSVAAESAVEEKASEAEELPASSSAEDVAEPETTDDTFFASSPTPVVDTPEDIPANDSQPVEQTVSDASVADESLVAAVSDASVADESPVAAVSGEPVADESLAAAVSEEPVADEALVVAVPDEVAPSDPAVEEPTESSVQDVSERSIGEEVPAVAKAVDVPDIEERSAEPSSEEEAAAPESKAEIVVAPVAEEEPAASTPLDDAIPGLQETVEPADDASEPADVDVSVSDEVVPENAVAAEPFQPEPENEEQNDVVVETLDNADSTKEIAEPESVTDEMSEEQPTTSTGHVDSSDADAAEADRSIPGEPDVAVDALEADVPTESAAPLNDTPVVDASEDLEVPAEESDD